MVDEVRDPQARLPLLTPEVQFVGDALRTFIAWPRRLIMPFTRQKELVHCILNNFLLFL